MSSIIYCVECGKELEPKSAFCDNCGTKVPSEANQTVLAKDEKVAEHTTEKTFSDKCGAEKQNQTEDCENCKHHHHHQSLKHQTR